MSALGANELARYARQIRLPQLGLGGQEKLKGASVLVVGVGGLGSPAATYLAAAGVGLLGIVDGDRVDVSNLHRQPIHRTDDVGREKTSSAADALRALNPHVELALIPDRLTSANALDVVSQFDVVIDATDNFPTRYLLNDACVITRRPLIYGSVDRFEGQLTVFSTEDGPCYRCLFPQPPEPGSVQNCAEAGVLGVLPGLVGVMQATEALKLLLGLGDALIGRLLLVDTLGMRFRSIAIDRDPTCAACGTRAITTLLDYDAFCGVTPHEMTHLDASLATVLPRDLARELENNNSITVIDVREPWEWDLGRIPGARLIPLGTVEDALGEINLAADIVVYCHHGVRSAMAASILRDAGATRVRNLVGGIDRWSTDVDPAVQRY